MAGGTHLKFWKVDLCPAAPPAPPSGFFVATNGSDSNPGTFAQPFATLEKAQAAMQAQPAGGIKTTYVRLGTYMRTSMFTLTSVDNGTTWSYYPPDGYNNAIIDGTNIPFSLSGNSNIILIQGGNNITIDGLQLQNFTGGGITIHGGAAEFGNLPSNFYQATGNAYGNTIENNIIHDLQNGGGPFHTGDGQNSSGVYSTELPGIQAVGQVQNTSVFNNVVYNMQTTGIALSCGVQGGSHANSTVSGNVIYNVNQSGQDTGGIYMQDVNHVSSGVKVTNNFLRDVAGVNNTGINVEAIYLDNGQDGVTVSGNVVAGTFTNFTHINDGSNLVYKNNIIDLGSGNNETIIKDQNFSGSGTDLLNNFFENNIVIANNATNMGTAITWAGSVNANQTPTWQNDDFFNYGGPSTLTTDQEPGASHVNPSITGWTYDLAPNSPMYSAPVNFVALTRGWGPPGYTIPQSGTAPSCPH